MKGFTEVAFIAFGAARHKRDSDHALYERLFISPRFSCMRGCPPLQSKRGAFP
jgi:hypothetical protein